jgi:hypothetical protein
MAKDGEKDTPNPPSCGNQQDGKSSTAADKPTVDSLDAEPLIAGLTHPGDTEAEAAARRFLYYRMLRNPTAKGENKDSLTDECEKQFGISGRKAVEIFDKPSLSGLDRQAALDDKLRVCLQAGYRVPLRLSARAEPADHWYRPAHESCRRCRW